MVRRSYLVNSRSWAQRECAHSGLRSVQFLRQTSSKISNVRIRQTCASNRPATENLCTTRAKLQQYAQSTVLAEGWAHSIHAFNSNVIARVRCAWRNTLPANVWRRDRFWQIIFSIGMRSGNMLVYLPVENSFSLFCLCRVVALIVFWRQFSLLIRGKHRICFSG